MVDGIGSARRSTRSRVPRKRYASEVADVDNDTESSGQGPAGHHSDSASNSSQSGDDAGGQDVSSDESVVGSDFEEHLPRRKRVPKRVAQQTPKKLSLEPIVDDGLSSRGVAYPGKLHRRDRETKFAFGPAPADLDPLRESARIYMDILTLPSRAMDANRTGGMQFSLYVNADAAAAEAERNWGWYFEEGREAFDRGQHTTPMSLAEAKKYNVSAPSDYQYLIGPLSKQKTISQPQGTAKHLEEIWPDIDSTNDKRPGWIVNLGEPVKCVDWAPGIPGLVQYLAVSTSPDLAEMPSPFKPSDPSPASIQIWAFQGTPVTAGAATSDRSVLPRQVVTICVDWGRIRQFKWCPMTRPAARDHEQGLFFGLLAILTTDGSLRVLNIRSPDSGRKTVPPHSYLHVSKAAVEARPPGTVCSCLAWLSPTTLATGCANGCIAVWDIRPQLFDAVSDSSPLLYIPLHSTYIQSITTAYPSRPPHFICTCSLDGHVRLTDLRSPVADSVISVRSRIMTPALAWHDTTQTFLAADDSQGLRAYSLRSFFTGSNLIREPSDIWCIATSPCHSSILYGCTDGTAASTNPLRRVMAERRGVAWHRQVWFKHEWARWSRRQTSDMPPDANASTLNSSLPSAGSEPNPLPLASGLSRFTEGYPLTIAGGVMGKTGTPAFGMAHSNRATTKKPKASRSKKKKNGEAPPPPPPKPQPQQGVDGTTTTIVYEEHSGVRCIAWNPEVHVGGWAAAGLGSGLLRVEDLAMDF